MTYSYDPYLEHYYYDDIDYALFWDFYLEEERRREEEERQRARRDLLDYEYDEATKHLTITGGSEFVAEKMFVYNNLTIRSVSIPDTIESIEKNAFKDAGLIGSLIIPDSVTEISDDAFIDNRLRSVELPSHFRDDAPYEAFDNYTLVTFRDDDNLAPMPEYNIIKSMIGKGKLFGTEEADQFTFDQYEIFNKRTADRITGFDSSKGDTIAVSRGACPSLVMKREITFATASTKEQFRQLSRQDIDFVYFQDKGRLFFNGNGADKGWGDPDEGGIFAFMKDKPELSADDFTLLA